MSSPSPNYTELGVQAVGLPGWTLLPGMRFVDSDGIYPYRVLSVSPFFAAFDADRPPPMIAVGQARGDIPDFHDAATKGCLIELARRRHGPTTTAIASLSPSTGKVTEWYVGNNQRVLCVADDEIEAYVRALEVEP